MTTKVWVVTSRGVPLSAWFDVYDAKFEAARWEQDSKIPHEYVEATLTMDEPCGATE